MTFRISANNAAKRNPRPTTDSIRIRTTTITTTETLSTMDFLLHLRRINHRIAGPEATAETALRDA